MKKKPSEGQTIVYGVRRVWLGIYRVDWSDSLNYPRSFRTLFRKVSGVWSSGEEFPTGVHGDLLRPARSAISQALNLHTAKP